MRTCYARFIVQRGAVWTRAKLGKSAARGAIVRRRRRGAIVRRRRARGGHVGAHGTDRQILEEDTRRVLIKPGMIITQSKQTLLLINAKLFAIFAAAAVADDDGDQDGNDEEYGERSTFDANMNSKNDPRNFRVRNVSFAFAQQNWLGQICGHSFSTCA